MSRQLVTLEIVLEISRLEVVPLDHGRILPDERHEGVAGECVTVRHHPDGRLASPLRSRRFIDDPRTD